MGQKGRPSLPPNPGPGTLIAAGRADTISRTGAASTACRQCRTAIGQQARDNTEQNPDQNAETENGTNDNRIPVFIETLLTMPAGSMKSFVVEAAPGNIRDPA